MRDGQKQKEHLRRFDPVDGIYKNIPNYLIIDFHEDVDKGLFLKSFF